MFSIDLDKQSCVGTIDQTPLTETANGQSVTDPGELVGTVVDKAQGIERHVSFSNEDKHNYLQSHDERRGHAQETVVRTTEHVNHANEYAMDASFGGHSRQVRSRRTLKKLRQTTSSYAARDHNEPLNDHDFTSSVPSPLNSPTTMTPGTFFGDDIENEYLPWSSRKVSVPLLSQKQWARRPLLQRRWSEKVLDDDKEDPNDFGLLGEKPSLSSVAEIVLPETGVSLSTLIRYSFLSVSALFALQVAAVWTIGPTIQGLSAPLTEYYQRALDNESYEDLSDFLHHAVTSHAWLLLCAIVYWSVDAYEGANLYCLTSIGYYLKSLAKNLIKSPRVFWVSEQIQCFYCGKGYSLPSGHSMISLLVLLFCAYKIRDPWIWVFLVLFEGITFVNVVYIGTHSFADVLVGWTGALLVFLAYLGVEHVYMLNRCVPTLGQQLRFFCINLVFILSLDLIDTSTQQEEFPAAYQLNMARACRIAPDKIVDSMSLPMRMSNTWGLLGLAFAFVFRSEMLNDKYKTNMDKMLWWERLLTLAVGTVVFMKSSVFVGRYLRFMQFHGVFHQVYNFLLPILVLVCVPVAVLLITRLVTHDRYKKSRHRHNERMYHDTVNGDDVRWELHHRSRERVDTAM
ncbi:hypothetical protein SARC_06227 [Sphaeroforma arctica JP610]|uniref:Phosphatidic acid phosphatase type 2/haloperoxidase domain-containing protein n=1 Tax=Sphaeroforma arctica JP610 TaxID=667725 RepID=A0A0L0FZR2_9EUKA|nr:hypothetical protein SARC_06227 [Sphaeroforma arctica JP610]KNC81458.1 hypothetical protein SARC_06227 [Sphaeroforma arctica JP610]|eukprot:XP_014155360.1 hypothetical protein SARC_06227 [Sphaeroforma arctica JP610]